MDAVHQAQQNLDIGTCSQHHRVFQCYCTQCYCMICPNCLMFDAHKGHSVCRIQQGARQIRTQINNAAKEGLLKFEKTEAVLLDIRHGKLTIQQNQENIIKQAENYFDQIIAVFKARKRKVIAELKKHFDEQIQLVEQAQNDWINKQQISQKILQLQGSNDDVKLVEEARYVVQGLQNIKRNIQFKNFQLISGIKTNFEFGKNQLSHKQFKEFVKDYCSIIGKIKNQLKC